MYIKTMFAPVNPVMVVEGRDNGKVLVDAYQESCQQGGKGDQGGRTSQEVAQRYEHIQFFMMLQVQTTWTRMDEIEGGVGKGEWCEEEAHDQVAGC